MDNNFSYIKNYSISNFSFDLGSDWHLTFDSKVVDACVRNIQLNKKSEFLFLLGDIFDTPDGTDSSLEISELLNRLICIYDLIFFVPGNHDLRGRDNPWGSFQLSKSVLMPYQFEPRRVVLASGINILLANIFYDLDFMDPAIINSNQDEVVKFYTEKTVDGTYLLNGQLSDFKRMAQLTRAALGSDIDFLATHTLPHNFLIRFKLQEATLSEEVLKLVQEEKIKIIWDPEEDQRRVKEFGADISFIRWFDNMKSFIMGSNILAHPESANFKDGLVALYGHNHRSQESTVKINNKEVKLISYQPPARKNNYGL